MLKVKKTTYGSITKDNELTKLTAPAILSYIKNRRRKKQTKQDN